jgi:hypothetical protein
MESSDLLEKKQCRRGRHLNRRLSFSSSRTSIHPSSNCSIGRHYQVEQSWNKLKSIPHYQDIAGQLILTRLFELESRALFIFGWSPNQDILLDPSFTWHAKTTVDRVEMAVEFLGPDLEPLKDDLQELGRRHYLYGVPPAYLPFMEQAIMYALEKMLGKALKKQDRKAWRVIFKFIISCMQTGMQPPEEMTCWI